MQTMMLIRSKMALTHYLASSVMVFMLVACGTTTPPPKPTAQVRVEPAPVKIVTSDDYLAMAKQQDNSPTLLLRAAEAAQNEQKYQKSQVIARALDTDQTPLAIRQQLVLVQANNLIALDQLNAAEQVLDSPMGKSQEIQFQVAQIKAQLFSQQKRYIESLRQLFSIEKAIENGQLQGDQHQVAGTIWEQLNILPNIALISFEYEAHTNAKSWLSLVELTRRYAGQPSLLQQQLKDWYELHPWHTAMSVLPESFQRSLTVTPFSPRRIAVILPMSGKLRQQAKAIRNGILLANQKQTSLELMFIDSELPLTTIEQKLVAQQVEFIIGPLQKEKVQQFSLSPIISTLPTIFLNDPDNSQMLASTNPLHFFFGLNPEDEVKQAAEQLFKLGFKKPSIIAPSNATGERLTDVFIKTWLSQRTNSPIQRPETSYFTSQADMQTAVKNILEVEQSKQRINYLSRIISKPIKTESRNRKDLDVIYIIGNSIQTKLIKPFIDVNTSPFNDPLPVYGTSRSHTIENGTNDRRDLRSLTFTEIPWLLASERKYQAQRETYEQLWPDQSESMRRLFALGHDALFLVDRVAQLRVLNGLSEQGMTGAILVDHKGFISRRHLWAQYNGKGEIEPVNFN